MQAWVWWQGGASGPGSIDVEESARRRRGQLAEGAALNIEASQKGWRSEIQDITRQLSS